MSESPNPWNRSNPPPSRGRIYVWLGLMLAVTVGVWLLSRLFPERTLTGNDWARVLQLSGFLALVGSSIVMSRRFTLRESLRNIAIWAGIAAVLVVCYLYQDLFSDFGVRLRSEFLPREPVAAGTHSVVLTQSEDGSYFMVGEVNGTRVNFLIDTGASDIVLSPADAKRVGINTAVLQFIGETETANGVGRVAHYTVADFDVGPIHRSDVDVSINGAPMSSSLLGMSFLKSLKSFEFKGRKLYLDW